MKVTQEPLYYDLGAKISSAPRRRYEIYIMPLNIPDMDGLFARVLAKL